MSLRYGGNHSTGSLPGHLKALSQTACLSVRQLRSFKQSSQTNVSDRQRNEWNIKGFRYEMLPLKLRIGESRSICRCIPLGRGQQALTIHCLFIYLSIPDYTASRMTGEGEDMWTGSVAV
jgi:hypothetical protein